MNIESFNSDKHLSYEELVEYSRGNLSNSEMHRLEQHLISCELCNDALEGVGLVGYEDAGATLERLKETTGAKETSGLGLYHYIGIAASILLVAIIGFVFTRYSNEPERLAAETVEDKAEEVADLGKVEKSYAPTLDSAIEIVNETEDLTVIESEPEASEPVPTTSAIEEQEPEVNALVANQPDSVDEGVVSDVIIADLDLEARDSAIAGQGVEDSVVVAMNEMIADDDQEATKSRMAAPTEALMTDEPAAMAKKAATGGPFVAAAPARGQKAFERYLRRNLVYPPTAKENNITGDVVLSVTINADGGIGEIAVTTSLGYGCDEEAIRLVREGQAWTPATRGGTPVVDKATVTVSFKP